MVYVCRTGGELWAYSISVVMCVCLCPRPQVSATFAASLVISPSLGNLILYNYPGEYGEKKVIALATLVSVLNLAFILFCVPESLPESVRKSSWGSSISWEQADPFAVRLGVGWGMAHVCQRGRVCVCVPPLLVHLILTYGLFPSHVFITTYICTCAHACVCIGTLGGGVAVS